MILRAYWITCAQQGVVNDLSQLVGWKRVGSVRTDIGLKADSVY